MQFKSSNTQESEKEVFFSRILFSSFAILILASLIFDGTSIIRNNVAKIEIGKVAAHIVVQAMRKEGCSKPCLKN